MQASTESAWLAGPLGSAALALAADLPAGLAGVTELRRRQPDLTAGQASAVMTQADLRIRARHRYGIEGPWLLTRDGLEQASRPEVSRWRASRLARAGVQRVIDATAGLGFDSLAFRDAGLEVTAIEKDPDTAVFLAHNVPGITVIVDDCTEVLGQLDTRDAVVFVDPARRDHRRSVDGARAHPERDPQRWSPPWSWVRGLDARVVAKVSAGFDPPWPAAWISVDSTVVECCTASWPMFDGGRCAVVMSHGEVVAEVVAPAEPGALVPSPDAYLYELDPAVHRAGSLASNVQGISGRISDSGVWLTGTDPAPTPAVRPYRCHTELLGDRRQRRRVLADLGITRAIVKTRDADLDPARERKELGVDEGGDQVVICLRHDGNVRRFLATS